MLLGYSLSPFGHHPSAWQETRDVRNLNFGALLAQVAAAEEAGFDFVLLADRLGLRPTDDLSSLATPFEPTLLASALATKTKRIGLVAAAQTLQHEPYNLARRLASLDSISNGRGGWLVVPASLKNDREREYVDLVDALWDSWEDDAFVYDKAAGRFFDPAKMHVLDHKGPHFSVRGPLNVNRSPQGKPVVAQVVDEDDSSPAAATGELRLLQARTPEGLVKMARIADQAVEATARRRDEVRLLANIVPIIAETSELAGAASDALPFSDHERMAQPLAAVRVVGTPPTIADALQAMAASSGVDGFTILPPTIAMAQRFFIDVVPELRQRGLLDTKPDGTFRDRLGLARPPHPAANGTEARR